MSAMSNYLENKIVDWLYRGQTFTPPATRYFALFTTAPSDAGGGTEVSAAGYARVAVASSLANFAGTQAAASTTASSGTSGATSNNVAITYGLPTANWGIITHMATFDALTGGNMLEYGALSVGKTVNAGDAGPSFAISAFTFQVDD